MEASVDFFTHDVNVALGGLNGKKTRRWCFPKHFVRSVACRTSFSHVLRSVKDGT